MLIEDITVAPWPRWLIAAQSGALQDNCPSKTQHDAFLIRLLVRPMLHFPRSTLASMSTTIPGSSFVFPLATDLSLHSMSGSIAFNSASR